MHTRVADFGLVGELSMDKGFPLAMYSNGSSDTPFFIFFANLGEVENMHFWATPILNMGKFLALLRNGVKT